MSEDKTNELVEHEAVTQAGGTFAERAGKKPPKIELGDNSTFVTRAKSSAKAVDGDDAEDKAVSSAQTKSRRKA